MGYIKVAHREILRQLDNISFFPTGWNKFVEKQTISHNLIIKSSKNSCYCTYCHNTFISTKKVNEKAKCPYCHNKYLIKRSNLKHYEFKDYLSILDKVNSTLIVRYFELVTDVDKNHNTTSSVVEFGREIPNKTNNRTVYINDRVSKCQGCIYISHSNYCNEKKWREYTRNYSLIDYSIPFPNNIKKVLKDTPYKHSEIWNIVKHSPFYLDLVKLIQDTSEIPKIEMLAKLKLYNLALNHAEWFFEKGSFEKRFGVKKNFYDFMKKHDISYEELYVLKLIQRPNIEIIRSLLRISFSNLNDLEKANNYISLVKLAEYSKTQNNFSIQLYLDYIDNLMKIGIPLTKKKLLPANFSEAHDISMKKVKIAENKLLDEKIKQRYEELKRNNYKDNKFCIRPAKTLNDMKDESNQQNNCVYSNYSEKYANGITDIYFLRKLKNPDKSLVTVEVLDGKVRQKYEKRNTAINKEEKEFLNLWEKNILNVA